MAQRSSGASWGSKTQPQTSSRVGLGVVWGDSGQVWEGQGQSGEGLEDFLGSTCVFSCPGRKSMKLCQTCSFLPVRTKLVSNNDFDIFI